MADIPQFKIKSFFAKLNSKGDSFRACQPLNNYSLKLSKVFSVSRSYARVKYDRDQTKNVFQKYKSMAKLVLQNKICNEQLSVSISLEFNGCRFVFYENNKVLATVRSTQEALDWRWIQELLSMQGSNNRNQIQVKIFARCQQPAIVEWEPIIR